MIKVSGEESKGRQLGELQSAGQEEGKCFMLTVHFSSITKVCYIYVYSYDSMIRVLGEESKGRQPEELQSADQEEGKCCEGGRGSTGRPEPCNYLSYVKYFSIVK